MSESNNDNPNALIEVSAEMAAFIAEGSESPVDVAPLATTPSPTETTPAVIETPAPSDNVPEWFADVPEDKRAATVQRMIEALPPAERNNLPAIQETHRNASQQTAAQVNQQTQAQIQQGQRDAALEQAAADASTALKAHLHPDSTLDVDGLINEALIPAAQAQYHDTMAASIEQGLLGTLSLLGVQEIPATVVAAIAAAPDYGSVIRAYGDFFANRGFELGKIAQKNEAGQTSEVDKAAMTARYKAWGIAEAAKSGRVRITKDVEGLLMELLSDTPVPLGSGGEGGISGPGEITEEMFLKAMNDPDYYDQLQNDPVTKAAWGRTIAEAMASV